jgi:predicted Zn-dependent peptidase
VVLEEIRMVEDDPEDLVQEIHTKQVLGRHPLGRPILGQASTIKRLQRQQLLDYVETHYDADRIVIAAAGNFDEPRLEGLVQRLFGSPRCRSGELPNRWPPEVWGGTVVRRKPLEQVHLCLGLKGLAASHKDRYAAHALNSVLGGSVSSRLFQEIREKRGLAYSIYSFLSPYSDGGMITIYAGTRPQEAKRVVDLVCREIKRLCRHGVEPKELVRAKNQMKGTLMLNLESSHSRMSKLAKDELVQGAHTSLEYMLSEIDQVSEEQVSRVADELLDLDHLAVTALGPINERSFQGYTKN